MTNMMKSKIIVTLLFTLFAAAACSRSGNSLKKAEYCPVKHNPIKTASKSFSEKTVLDEKTELNLQPGKYEYERAEVFYVDRETDIRLHLSHKKGKEAKSSDSIKCIGGKGIRSDMKIVDYSVPFISSIDVSASGKTYLTHGLASIQIAPHSQAPWLNYEFTDNPEQKNEGSLKGQYPEFPETEQIFAKFKNNITFEYRAQLRSQATDKSKKVKAPFEVRILVRYKFTPAE